MCIRDRVDRGHRELPIKADYVGKNLPTSLEQSLSNDHGLLDGCAMPTVPGKLDYDANDNYPLVGQAHMDLMVMALACDLTRVTSLQWSTAQSGTRFTWLGHGSDHHGMSHEADTSGGDDGTTGEGDGTTGEGPIDGDTSGGAAADGEDAGGCGCATPRGRAHNDLYVSLLRAFGADVDTFGLAEVCTGPMPEL